MPAQNRTQKLIASTLVIVAVVVLALVVSAAAKKEESVAQSDTTSQVASTTDTATEDTTDVSTTADTSNSTSTASSAYKDGTYTSSDSYSSPGGIEGIDVSVTISNGVITAATIDQEANNHESEEYQDAFASSFKSKVVGKAIESLSLSRISGASLTTDGFNDALDEIRSQAQA